MDNPYRLYSSLPARGGAHTFAEINLAALTHNYRLLLDAARAGGADVRPICVVKADAYGHGAAAVSLALRGAGCDFFAVSCIEEAAALRSCLGESPDILILGYTDPRRAGELAEKNIIQTLISEEYITALKDCAALAGVCVRTHLKLDTGMNRLGLPAKSKEQIEFTANIAAAIAKSEHLRLEGMFTHFARADEEELPDQPAGDDGKNTPKRLSGEGFTALQLSRYLAVEELLAARGIIPPCRHVSNSAAAVRHPEFGFECVRLGIMLYGLLPSLAVSFPGLLPVMKLRSVISHTHTLTPGESVGYGGCFTSNIPRKIATIPVGYADGFLRAYTGCKISVRHGTELYRVPVVGRICMDQLTADVTGTPCRAGDTVTLFGESTGELAELSRRAGTIEYESLCIISSRVPRYYGSC